MIMKKLISMILALMLIGSFALAERTITVQGVGNVKTDANRAGISLGVREVAVDVKTAQGNVNEELDKVIEALRSMGDVVEAISTNSIGIYPNYSYSDDGLEQIASYTAYNSLYVTLKDVEAAGVCIDTAFAAGANSLDYVEFSTAGSEEAADKAMVLAVESARHKAETLAAAAGVKLGEIVEIRDGTDYGFDSNAAYARTTAEEDAGAGTSVMASKQTVSASVTITYAILDGEAQD